MKTRLPVVAVGFAVVCLGLARAGDAKKTKLEGSWAGEHKDKQVKLRFAGDKFTIEAGGDDDVIKGKFKLDVKKKPHTIDLTIEEAKKHVGETALGIYELSGTSLKLCLRRPGGEPRPEQFTADSNDTIFITLERKKD